MAKAGGAMLAQLEQRRVACSAPWTGAPIPETIRLYEGLLLGRKNENAQAAIPAASARSPILTTFGRGSQAGSGKISPSQGIQVSGPIGATFCSRSGSM